MECYVCGKEETYNMVTECCGIRVCKQHPRHEFLSHGRYCCPRDRRICNDHPLAQQSCMSCKRKPCEEHLEMCEQKHALCVKCLKNAPTCNDCMTTVCPMCTDQKTHTSMICMKRKCAKCSTEQTCEDHQSVMCPICLSYHESAGYCKKCINEIIDHRPQEIDMELWKLILLYAGAYHPRNIAQAVQPLTSFRLFRDPMEKPKRYTTKDKMFQKQKQIHEEFVQDFMYIKRLKLSRTVLRTRDLPKKYTDYEKCIFDVFYRVVHVEMLDKPKVMKAVGNALLG